MERAKKGQERYLYAQALVFEMPLPLLQLQDFKATLHP